MICKQTETKNSPPFPRVPSSRLFYHVRRAAVNVTCLIVFVQQLRHGLARDRLLPAEVARAVAGKNAVLLGPLRRLQRPVGRMVARSLQRKQLLLRHLHHLHDLPFEREPRVLVVHPHCRAPLADHVIMPQHVFDRNAVLAHQPSCQQRRVRHDHILQPVPPRVIPAAHLDVIRSMPFNIQPDRGGVESPDYVLTLKSSDGKKDAALLYCMDSHSYSKLPDVKGYDWLTFDQVNWYRRQSAAYKAKNGGQPLPALAFFHIPLPEYNEAASDENAILIGTRMEKACAPELNTGMFTAMKEAGDVMGMFVGHDHDNDYAVMWKGILLAYGRFTGGNTEYNHLSNGARVIVMKEGARTFTTWIRLKGGEIIDKTVYPDSYMKDDWRKRPLVTE